MSLKQRGAGVVFGLACIVTVGLAGCASQPSGTVRLSVIGTNDVHGELAGLATFSGYVDALRAARESDGAVVLLDAGDMWQGTLESNLSEGAPVVAAFNALGYDAVAVGNHEFDFGPAGERFIPELPTDDPRGALKTRALEAAFPMLAANVIDVQTGRPVAWPNVKPTVMIERAGVKVGVIGVTTSETLETTIRGNTGGLRIAPLVDTIEREARALKAAGANLIVVTAHAGGHCDAFGKPRDLDSCERDGEIFKVAGALTPGLVDQIIAGHTHWGVAHVVNGIAITESFAHARAFGRVDYIVSRATGEVLNRQVFPPQRVCTRTTPGGTACARGSDGVPASYEGRTVTPVASVAQIADAALAAAAEVKSRPLGVVLRAPLTRQGGPTSALGRLMTDAVREATGADVAIHNVVGGIRDDLPAGPLSFGDVFRAFPFDNRITVLPLSGRALRTLFAHQVHNEARRAGVSGLVVTATCQDGELNIEMTRSDGTSVADDDVLTVAANDYLLLGGDRIFQPITPAGGFDIDNSQPRVRDAWAQWFESRGGAVDPADYAGTTHRRWRISPDVIARCPRPAAT